MTSYGHVDMMDQTYIDIIQVLVIPLVELQVVVVNLDFIVQAISFCKTDSSTDKDAFRQVEAHPQLSVVSPIVPNFTLS